jgi:hypothetical protein
MRVRVYFDPRDHLEHIKGEANVRPVDSQPVVLGDEISGPAPAPAGCRTGSTKDRGINSISQFILDERSDGDDQEEREMVVSEQVEPFFAEQHVAVASAGAGAGDQPG